MNKNIKLLLIPAIILVGGKTTLNNNICYSMDNLPLTQKSQNQVPVTDDDLIQLIRKSQLKKYGYDALLYAHYDVLLYDLANHYSNIHINVLDTNRIYRMMRDIQFTYVSLSKDCPSDEEYVNLKSTLDNITFKRPKLIHITPLNSEDTITLTQFWNFIQNKTDYINGYYLNKIYALVHDKNDKNDKYYLKILDTISSLYNDLYAFLTDASKYIKQYSAKNNGNKLLTELNRQCDNNISTLELLNKDMMSWVNFHKALILLNMKCEQDINKYLSNKDQSLDPLLVDNIMVELSTTILDYTSTPFKQWMNKCAYITEDDRKRNIEYEKACSSIFRCFQTIYTSLTLRNQDEALMLEDYGDDKDKITLDNIQWTAKYLAEKLDPKFYNKNILFKDNNKYDDLFKDKDQNSEITCDQLLQYCTNNISKKVIHTIQNIARDVLKKNTRDYTTLYGILNSNINKFVAEIEPITKPLLNFLNTELNTNEKIKDNVMLRRVFDQLLTLDKKYNSIKKHEINTQKAINDEL